jgi:hypothetical protein
MKKVLLVAVVVAVLLLLVVPVGVAKTHLPLVALKDNGTFVVGGDVLVPAGTPAPTLSCTCHQLRYENPTAEARRHVPQ